MLGEGTLARQCFMNLIWLIGTYLFAAVLGCAVNPKHPGSGVVTYMRCNWLCLSLCAYLFAAVLGCAIAVAFQRSVMTLSSNASASCRCFRRVP